MANLAARRTPELAALPLQLAEERFGASHEISLGQPGLIADSS